MARLLFAVQCFVFGNVFFHVLAVLFGAPIFEDFIRTWLLGSLMSLCTVFPAALILGNVEDIFRLYFDREYETDAEACLFYVSVSAVIGAWFGAFPIPLDWDRPWQRWPITCVIGTLLGVLAGYLIFHSRAWQKYRFGLKNYKLV